MSYGLKITNPSGGLVIDSAGFGMNYIGSPTYYGTATYSQLSVSMGGDYCYTNGTPIATLSEYRITTTATSILPFIALSTATSSLVTIEQVDPSTWSIFTYSNQPGLEMFVFAKTSVKPTRYGMALYDSSGNVTYNLVNAGSPLFFESIGSFPDDSVYGYGMHPATISGAPLSSFTKPAVFGWNLGVKNTIVQGVPKHPLEINTYWIGTAYGIGVSLYNGNLYRNNYPITDGFNQDTGSDMPPAPDDSWYPATDVVIIEADGLVTA